MLHALYGSAARDAEPFSRGGLLEPHESAAHMFPRKGCFVKQNYSLRQHPLLLVVSLLGRTEERATGLEACA